MEHASQSAGDGDPHDLGCREAQALLQGFAAGEPRPAHGALLRAHVEGCLTCRDAYRSAVITVARLASARREQLQRVSSVSAADVAHALDPWPRRGRKLVLSRGQGAFLVLGFIAMVLFLAPSAPRSGVEFRSLGGVAWAGQERVDEAGGPRPIERSQSCMTGRDARARLEAHDAELVLEPQTAVAVERVRPLRVRLFEGTLIVRGTCVITNTTAVIEVRDGDGWVSFDGTALRVGVAHGAMAVTDPHGAHALQAGSVWVQDPRAGDPSDG